MIEEACEDLDGLDKMLAEEMDEFLEEERVDLPPTPESEIFAPSGVLKRLKSATTSAATSAATRAMGSMRFASLGMSKGRHLQRSTFSFANEPSRLRNRRPHLH